MKTLTALTALTALTTLTTVPKHLFFAFFMAAMAAVISACAPTNTGGGDPDLPREASIATNSYEATDRLIQTSRQTLDKGNPVLVASLVNVANLERTSNLGRIIAEQVSSRLTQRGFETKEMRFRGSFLVQEGGGEFILSRAIQDISRKQDAQAVITGVYAVARDEVYITLRLIRAADGVVLSSVDYALPMTPNIAALLAPYDLLEY